VRPSAPVAAVLAAAAVLIFINLGRDHLWADEGDTAVLAASILDHGVPTAWDGVTFSDADYGKRLTDDFVMVSHPWLQYYVAAASFAVFGETAFAARLPFALLGLATIFLAYVIVVRASGDRRAGITAAILLTLSVQFLLYARQSRNYTLNAALTCLLVLQFTRLDSWRRSALFALTAILLFHSHPIGVAPVGVLGLLTLVYAPFQPQRRWFWLAMPAVALFTVPWLFVGREGVSESTKLIDDLGAFVPRLAQYGIEVASVTSLVGVLLLSLWLKRRVPPPAAAPKRRRSAMATPPARSTLFTADERTLVLMLVAIIGGYTVMVALTLARDAIWMAGMRYTPAVIAFGAMLAGMLIAKASRGRWQPWLALVLVFGCTRFARLTPWTFWEEPTAIRRLDAPVTFHTPPQLVDRVLRTGLVAYVQSLFVAEPGTTAKIVEYLKQHAAPNDIVVTNYGWEPIYFHTGLAQGMKILPTYPIYDEARERQLPSYVFSPEGARWVVWRPVWGPYRGHELDRLIATLQEARVPVTRVATIEETVWENRENVHFRRYPGDRYIFDWYDRAPDAVIYRVDWPRTPAGG
jgi:4-amino-4-deoxy-L-arabinose transferase-like glycosyltransferase